MTTSRVLPPAMIDFGRYNLLVKLGQGGMGAVFLARQKTLRRFCAIKVMNSLLAQDAENAARFLLEARASASLSHPHLIEVFDGDQHQGQYFIGMEYVEGMNLSEIIRKGGPIPVPLAIYWLQQAAMALEFIHGRHVIHRDIKPDNMMISQQGILKLMDLGLAKSCTDVEGSMTVTGTVMGSPFYISPEQINDSKTVDFRTDIYSLGITAYHMVTGNVPYQKSSAAAICIAHLQEPMPSVALADVGVTRAMDTLISKMVAKDRDQRFASTEELRAHIEQWASSFPMDDAAQTHFSKIDMQPRKVESVLEKAGISMMEVDQDLSPGPLAPPQTFVGEERSAPQRWMPWLLGAIALLLLLFGGSRFVRKQRQNMAVAKPAASAAVISHAPTTITPSPVARMGMLNVRTVPADALVMFRSKSQHAPATFEDVPIGKYTVQISKPGFIDVEAEVLIQEEKPAQLNVNLEKATTAIHLETVPSGAKVFVDNEYKGVTPYELKGPFDQLFHLDLEKEGFASHEQPLKFWAQDRSMVIHLIPAQNAAPKVAGQEPSRTGTQLPGKARNMKEHLLEMMDAARVTGDVEWPGQKEQWLNDIDSKLAKSGMDPGSRQGVSSDFGQKLDNVRAMSQDQYEVSRLRISNEMLAILYQHSRKRGFSEHAPSP